MRWRDLPAGWVLGALLAIMMVAISATLIIHYPVHIERPDDIEAEPAPSEDESFTEVPSEHGPIEGYLDENSQNGYSFEPEDGAFVSLRAVLEWEDEAQIGPTYTNLPDEFQLSIESSDGSERASPMTGNLDDGSGRVEISLEVAQGSAMPGSWTVTVTAGEAGDQVALLRQSPDDGNDYTLSVTMLALQAVEPDSTAPAKGGGGIPVESVILSLSGLLNAVFGLFLLSSIARDRRLEELVSVEAIPILVAGFIFLFNGMGLIVTGGTEMTWHMMKSVFNTLANSYFYQFIALLLLLFGLYYPRPYTKWMEGERARIAGLGLVVAYTALILVLGLIDQFYLRHNPELAPILGVRVDGTTIMSFIYVLCLSVLLTTLTTWYYYRDLEEKERDLLSMLLVGFLLTPMTMFWAYFGPGGEAMNPNAVPAVFETIIANGFTLFILYKTYQQREETGSLRKRDMLMVGALCSTYLFATLAYAAPELVFGVVSPQIVGFAIIRPIFFTLAILRYGLFNIDIPRRIVLYSTIVVMIGVAFFWLEETLQDVLPLADLVAILLVVLIFIPLSPLAHRFTNWLVGKFTDEPRGSRASQDVVVVGLFDEVRESLTPRRLGFLVAFGVGIELLENSVTYVIEYPAVLKIVFIGILFSVVDYIMEREGTR